MFDTKNGCDGDNDARGGSDAVRGRARWGTVCIKPPKSGERGREKGMGREKKRLYTES